jgi:MFS family permease
MHAGRSFQAARGRRSRNELVDSDCPSVAPEQVMAGGASPEALDEVQVPADPCRLRDQPLGGPRLAGGAPDRRTQLTGMVVGSLVGIAVCWNTTNVGAVAAETASAYGLALAGVGLFMTSLFITHFLAQVPGGRLIDRLGARRVCIIGCGIIAGGAALSMAAPSPVLGIAARAVTGIGTGLGFLAASAYVRRTGGSPFAQGLYGGIGLGAGGLAIAVVPEFLPLFSWRAPYATSVVLAALALAALMVAPADPRADSASAAGSVSLKVLSDADLRRLGLLYSVAFGTTVALSNWIAELLERHGMGAEAGAVGALILGAGVVTRPLGGWILRNQSTQIRTAVGSSLVAGCAGCALLGIANSAPIAVVGCLFLGIGGGIPFSPAFTGAAVLRPDAPAAAVGFVNAMAAAAVLVFTPLVGLTFSAPGDGRIGFALASLAWLVALATLPDRRAFTGT